MSAIRTPPPTIDDVAAALPPISQALNTIADALDALVTVTCRATNLPEQAADMLNDAGQTLIAHSRTLMHEAQERCRTGPGRAALLPRPAARQDE